jgi:hypothetical protein
MFGLKLDRMHNAVSRVHKMAASINDWCYAAEKQMYMSNEYDE